jgi:micrococcal nuclease
MKLLMLYAIALLMLQTLPLNGEPVGQVVTGKVVGVHDGDTVTVLAASNQTIKVRLNGIDAPELAQAFGNRSKQALSSKVFGHTIVAKITTRDRYGRSVAELWSGTNWVNLAMVTEGWAWHYVKYSQSPVLAKAEQQARKNGLGLWADANPVPPWEFRLSKRAPERH